MLEYVLNFFIDIKEGDDLKELIMTGVRQPISEVIINSFEFYTRRDISTSEKLFALSAHLNVLYSLRANFKPPAYERSADIAELEQEVHKIIGILEPKYQEYLGLVSQCKCPR